MMSASFSVMLPIVGWFADIATGAAEAADGVALALGNLASSSCAEKNCSKGVVIVRSTRSCKAGGRCLATCRESELNDLVQITMAISSLAP